MLTFCPFVPKAGCEDLPDPDYGKVKQTGNHVGAKATYTCDYGYRLYGSKTRKCLDNGYWSDDEPECKRSELDDINSMREPRIDFFRHFKRWL